MEFLKIILQESIKSILSVLYKIEVYNSFIETENCCFVFEIKMRRS